MPGLFGKRAKAAPAEQPPVKLTADEQLQIALEETRSQKKILQYLQMQMQMELQGLEMKAKQMAQSADKRPLRVYARGIIQGQQQIAKIEDNLTALSSFEDKIRSTQINMKIQKQLGNVNKVLGDVITQIGDKGTEAQVKQFVQHSDRLQALIDLQNDALDSIAQNVDDNDVENLIDQ